MACLVATLLEYAEEQKNSWTLDEVGMLNFVRPAVMTALAEGGRKQPPPRAGDHDEQRLGVMRDIRAVLGFVTEGGEQVRMVLSQTNQAANDHMDTQTTEEGTGWQSLFGPQTQADAGPWRPPLTTEQWPGSLPSTGDEAPPTPWPTDDELVAAMEAYEFQNRATDLFFFFPRA